MAIYPPLPSKNKQETLAFVQLKFEEKKEEDARRFTMGEVILTSCRGAKKK